MALKSLLFGGKPGTPWVWPDAQVDLGAFRCGRTTLGVKPAATEPYAAHFDSIGAARSEASGIEVGIEGGVLDSVSIDLASFTGILLRDGSALPLSTRTTTDEILAQFGPPYWTDNLDEDETILFYEYQRGKIELQFEFPGKRHLGFITLLRNGVLSKEEQRKAYRVTKAWPPR